MKRLSAHELRAARKAQDWNTLWEQSLPIVKFAISSMVRGGMDRHHCTDDTLQEASLAAGKAVRTWDPSKGEFSTWIVKRATGAIRNHINRERNGLIGGRDAYVATVEMQEERAPDLEAKSALGDLEGAERIRLVRDLLFRASDNPLDYEIVAYRFGFAGYPVQTMNEIARRVRLPLRTVERRLAKALRDMAGFAENSGYVKGYRETA